jgi:putative phosphoserine phosphatase/1-acylglycerol-3-phosphate O-acyltransferase
METTFSKDNSTGTNYIAFFDLDNTIISSNSGKLFIQFAYRKGLITTFDLIKGFFLSLAYRFDLRDTVKIIDSMLSWVKGISEASLNDFSAEIFKNHISGTIHQEVYAEIRFHKNKGARVVILSSAIYPVCRNVADYLGIDDIICTTPELENGVYTGRNTGPICFGIEKANRFNEYCNSNIINPKDSWYYGDSISDLAVLSTAGTAICVNPDKKLKKEAEKRGWKVLLWQ